MPQPTFLPIVPHLALPGAVLACTVLGLVAAVAVLALSSRRMGNSILYVWSMFVEQPIPQSGLNGEDCLLLCLNINANTECKFLNNSGTEPSLRSRFF